MNSKNDVAKIPQTRLPRQKRSQERFEAILDAAERTLETLDSSEISIYTVAEEARIPPASIYHFFPDAQHIFSALADRYFLSFTNGFGRPEPGSIRTWQDLIDLRYKLALNFYNSKVAIRKVILGSGSNWSIRARDFELDKSLAQLLIKELDTFFVVPAIPGLEDRVTETIVMNDALWGYSHHRHGRITEEAEDYARRARIAHIRTYFPEFLEPRRSVDEETATDSTSDG